MRRFYYLETDESHKRRYNKNISVWELKEGRFKLIGSSDHQTAGWKGPYASACDILHKERGYRYGADSYSLKSKSVELVRLPSGAY